jgi:hypothetical protein
MLQRATIFLLLFIVVGFSKPASGETLSPYQVKAAFIYNFLKFVEWPPQSFPTTDTPYVVGVLGKDPFGSVLDDTMRDKTVNGRKIHVIRVTEQNMHQCHLLFVSSSERRRYKEIFSRLKSAPVLLVGETDDFAESGGAIGFFIEQNKVRFEINPEAAKRSNLHIHSTLLNLARIVRTRS